MLLSEGLRDGVALACLVVGLSVAGGCRAGSAARRARLWAVGESYRVFPDTPVQDESDCFSRRDGRVKLLAAINETVGWQLAITAGPATLEQVRISIDPLVGKDGRIGPSHVRMYRQWFTRVERYRSWFLLHAPYPATLREFPDALIPLSGPTNAGGLSVPAGRTLPVWIDVTIPAGTRPGLYRSAVRVAARDGEVGRLDVELRVWPFALPSDRHLPVLVGLDRKRLFAAHLRWQGQPYVPVRLSGDEPLRDRAIGLIRRTFALLHAHRCSAYLSGYGPIVRADEQGQPIVDWSEYDQLVGGYMDGTAFADRVGLSGWPVPLTSQLSRLMSRRTAEASEVWNWWGFYLRRCAAHLQERGWLDRAFLWCELPVPAGAADYRFLRQLGRLAGQAEPPLPLASSVLPQPMGLLGWSGCNYQDVSELVEIFAPPGRFYDPATMRRLQGEGKRAWLRPDRPPFAGSLAIEAPLTMVRAIAWQAFRCGADGVLITAGGDWPDRPYEIAIERADQRSDCWLIWPGLPHGLERPIASIRLKQLRRGLQDYEYLWLLRRHERPELAELVAASLVKYVGTDACADNFADGQTDVVVTDPRLWSLARRLMGQELARAMTGQSPEPIERFARRLDWRRLLGQTRKLRLRVDGVRVRRAEGADGGFEVEFLATIRNELARAVSGELRFGGLPSGWSSVRDRMRIGPIQPLGIVRASLVARAERIVTDQDGVAHQQLVFDAGQDGLVRARARIAVLFVPQRDEAVAVDGDLSDWPLGLRNAAGSFLLFNRGDMAGGKGAEPARPRRQTVAFVLRDGQNIYLAIHCFEPEMGRVRSDKSNFVRYDGLVPSGEDLVEVLLDPGNAGLPGSGQLYHVVVKHNGVLISERGVGVSPPIGAHGAWPAGIQARVVDAADRWIVEMAIPLSAFDEAGRSSNIWGLNIGRFQASRGEYSNWAGARRYLYNAQSLGNIVWLPRPADAF